MVIRNKTWYVEQSCYVKSVLLLLHGSSGAELHTSSRIGQIWTIGFPEDSSEERKRQVRRQIRIAFGGTVVVTINISSSCCPIPSNNTGSEATTGAVQNGFNNIP
jgi:hypothetical protein